MINLNKSLNENESNKNKIKLKMLCYHHMNTFYKNLTLKRYDSFKDFNITCSKFSNLSAKNSNNSTNLVNIKKTFFKLKNHILKKNHILFWKFLNLKNI